MERDLTTDPIWEADHLGRPMPDNPHAVSVALPRWQDVVGYEEGKPEVISRMQLGYPRFVLHPLVRQLAARLTDRPIALPFTAATTANACAAFARARTTAPIEVIHQEPFHVVTSSTEGWPALKMFWQHSGRILSSRQAQAALEGRTEGPEGPQHRADLRRELAALYHCAPSDIWLYPTGMAAIGAALRATIALQPGRRTLQLGFPYVDTLKLQQRLTGAVHFIPDRQGRLLDEAATALDTETFAACFCEVPGNPLLGCPDIHRLSALLRHHQTPLIVDDVVATPFNINLHNLTDMIATSLTKYLAGSGDVMGGAVILSAASPFAEALRPLLDADQTETLWGEDAALLAHQARGFPDRMRIHNTNGEMLAEHLRHHPAVKQVWYPKWECEQSYNNLRRPEGGWGGLLSFVLHDAARQTPAFYDRLRLCKGPTLGTRFTLVCPFTLLAHYDELDWAESCGVPRYLMRVAAGIEPADFLWTRIKEALPHT